jgi:hypothetical protein
MKTIFLFFSEWMHCCWQARISDRERNHLSGNRIGKVQCGHFARQSRDQLLPQGRSPKRVEESRLNIYPEWQVSVRAAPAEIVMLAEFLACRFA